MFLNVGRDDVDDPTTAAGRLQPGPGAWGEGDVIDLAAAAGNHAAIRQMMAQLLPLAEQGGAEAQEVLGGCCGAVGQWAEAARWCRLAAEQHHAGAQYRLGLLHSTIAMTGPCHAMPCHAPAPLKKVPATFRRKYAASR